jgi:ketosteroid isomerase-like protein
VAPSNADRVREALALHREQGFAALIALADPEIEIRMGAGINAGEFRGTDEAERFNADWEDAWAEARYEVVEITEVDEANLIARIEMMMRWEGSGAEVTGTHWWLFELREGRFVRWHLYTDRESAMAAAGER